MADTRAWSSHPATLVFILDNRFYQDNSRSGFWFCQCRVPHVPMRFASSSDSRNVERHQCTEKPEHILAMAFDRSRVRQRLLAGWQICDRSSPIESVRNRSGEPPESNTTTYSYRYRCSGSGG